MVVFYLSACSSVLHPYTPTPEASQKNSRMIIEQIVMEQPRKLRPQSILINNEYLGLDYGVATNTKGFAIASAPLNNMAIGVGNKTTTTKFTGERIYFSSISALKIYKKGSRHFVLIQGGNDRVLKRIYMDSLKKAKRFNDALQHYIQNSTNLFR